MGDCELLAGCLFFNDWLKEMPTTAVIIKQRYCREEKTDCARYMVYRAGGREKVPPDLLPGDVERARRVIANLADPRS